MALMAVIGIIIGGLLFGASFVVDNPALLAIGAIIVSVTFIWGLTGAKLPEHHG